MSGQPNVAIMPPNVQAIEAETSPLLLAARSLQIAEERDLVVASDLLGRVKRGRGFLKEIFKDPKAKMRTLVQALNDSFNKYDNKLAEAEGEIKLKVVAYTDEQRRVQEAARRKVEEEARKKREEEKRIRDEEARQKAEAARKAGEEEEARRITEEAEKAPEPPPPPPPPPAPKPKAVEGLRTSQKWSAHVTDLKALCKAIGEGTAPADFVRPNQTELNAWARARKKKDLNLPGVEGVAETHVAAR